MFYFPEIPPLVQSWWLFLILGLVVGLWRAFPRLAVQSEISGADASIVIRIGDLFKQDGAIVVAAPTSFDTSIEDGMIDEKSTQGQYTSQFCDSLDSLNRQIEEALEGVEFSECDEMEKPYGSQKMYRVGTVASVKCSSKRAYFVAVTTLNAHRNASATLNDVLDALPALWEYIRTRGSMEHICIPVLGSGFFTRECKAGGFGEGNRKVICSCNARRKVLRMSYDSDFSKRFPGKKN